MPKSNNTMRIITNDDSKRLDMLASQRHHIPGSVLMEQAAGRIYAQLCNDYSLNGQRLAILAGRGNNGGDVLSLARCFGQNVDFDIYIADSGQYSTLNQLQQDILHSYGVSFRPLSSFCEYASDYTLVIDGIYGIGYRSEGESDALLCQIAQCLRQCDNDVVAIDIPSGLSDTDANDCCIRSDRTYSIGFRKAIFYDIAARPYCGTIANLPISFCIDDIDHDIRERQTYIADLHTVSAQNVHTHNNFVHKYTKGAVCVIGGSRGMIGAAVHCGQASLSAGAGIVSTLTNDDSLDAMNIAAPELVSDTVPHIEAYLHKYDAFVIGPGMSLHNEQSAQLRSFFGRMKRVVLDASFFTHYTPDVLTEFASAPVLTPHAGECMKFFSLDKSRLYHNTIETVRSLAVQYHIYLLLKSAVQYLGTPDGIVYVIDHPNEAAAQAGSGDLLTGIIAAQLCRTDDTVRAVLTGVSRFYGTIDMLSANGEMSYDAGAFISVLRQCSK